MVGPCLFSADEFNLRAAIGDAGLLQVLECAMAAKPQQHLFDEGFQVLAHAMSEIGG